MYSFPNLEPVCFPCPVLTVASWPAYRFLRRWVMWSGIPISFRIFKFFVTHTVKGFGIVNKAEVDVFLEIFCFLDDPMDVGNLISGSSAFSKSSLNIWKFTVHILLKPGLGNFELYFVSVWDECNCALISSGGQSIGVSASASVLPMNIQGWFTLGWIGWISLQSKGFSRVFSNTTLQKYQFFDLQPSLWSNSHICTWLLEKP